MTHGSICSMLSADIEQTFYIRALLILHPARLRSILNQKTATPDGITVFLVEEGGFEPPKRNATDLQSAPFGHSGTPPDLVVKATTGGPQIEAQLSGFDLERRRSEGNELSCLHGSERSETCVDVELVDGFEPPTC